MVRRFVETERMRMAVVSSTLTPKRERMKNDVMSCMSVVNYCRDGNRKCLWFPMSKPSKLLERDM